MMMTMMIPADMWVCLSVCLSVGSIMISRPKVLSQFWKLCPAMIIAAFTHFRHTPYTCTNINRGVNFLLQSVNQRRYVYAQHI